ncbi:MAG: hypothetical protein ACXWKT_20525, partial [Caulobacteraceae bacterium]
LTFTDLLEDTRRSLAASYADAGERSLTEIAGLLGYSSLSAFSRWRRRARARPAQGTMRSGGIG